VTKYEESSRHCAEGLTKNISSKSWSPVRDTYPGLPHTNQFYSFGGKVLCKSYIIILSRDRVTIDGLWIDNWIY
jgi:hypothetical protein